MPREKKKRTKTIKHLDYWSGCAIRDDLKVDSADHCQWESLLLLIFIVDNYWLSHTYVYSNLKT